MTQVEQENSRTRPMTLTEPRDSVALVEELKELIDSRGSPCDQRDIIYKLFAVLADTM